MKLFEYLLSHARGFGKTHHLACLLKTVKGTLVVSSEREAERIKRVYGINSIPYDINVDKLRGTHLGITYVDPQAIGLWIGELERQLAVEKQKTQEQKLLIEKLTGVIRDEDIGLEISDLLNEASIAVAKKYGWRGPKPKP